MPSKATAAPRCVPREWKGVCQRRKNCVLAVGHRGVCKVGVIEEEEYEVEGILAERDAGKRKLFLVKWRGWPEDDDLKLAKSLNKWPGAFFLRTSLPEDDVLKLANKWPTRLRTPPVRTSPCRWHYALPIHVQP